MVNCTSRYVKNTRKIILVTVQSFGKYSHTHAPLHVFTLLDAVLEALLLASAPWHESSCDLEAVILLCEQGQLLLRSATPGH